MSSSTDLAGLEDDDDLQLGPEVQAALTKGTDLRQYSAEIETALRSVERASIQDYLQESESLAGLHTQIRQCDGVLDGMESMLRGFQGDLANISAQIKYLQDESYSMNIKLRNRKSAETQLSGFIDNLVVPPQLVYNISEGEVNEAYLEYVLELNKKTTFARQEATSMTSAAADIAPELEKLRRMSVQKIREFLLQRVATLKKKMTNIQILQQSVLLKYTGLYKFLVEQAPEAALEIKDTYTTTMAGIYLRHFKGYLADLMRLRTEVATKSDLLGNEEWSGFSASSLFSSKPATARGDGAFKLGERGAVITSCAEAPLIPAVLQQAGSPLHYEAIFAAASTLLRDTVGCEYDFMSEFFGEVDAFENIFGKAIFHCMENLEQVLVQSWDAIGCLLLLRVNHEQRAHTSGPTLAVTLVSGFFQKVQVLVWSRFKAIMEAHVQSLAAFAAPKGPPEVHPHFVARRYAELVASLRLIKASAVESMLATILRTLRAEVERLLGDKLARQHATGRNQAAFLINSYHLIATTLAERGARGEDSLHFEQLLDSIKATFVEEQLNVDYGRLIQYVKQTEPLLMQGASPADVARADLSAMEHLLRSFHDTWRPGVESINRDVMKSFADLKLGMDILKQVLTQLLLYYTRFLDLVKQAYPNGAPFAQFIVSIPTLMKEIKNFSRSV